MAASYQPPALKLSPSGFFALRTALLPFDTLVNWAQGATAPAYPTENDMRASRALLVERLRDVIRRPEVREALFLASPSAYDETTRWLDSGKSDPRLERTLTRYVQRMAGRSTPFGLFAGCSSGRLGTATDLQLAPMASYRRNSRLDNEHLAAVAYAVGRREDVRRDLVLKTNTSLYRFGGRYRYVQTQVRGGVRAHKLIALQGDEYLDAVVERARAGAKVDALVRTVLAADPDGDVLEDDARRYILELVDRDLLVSELEPLVTGGEPIDDLISQLANRPAVNDIVGHLRRVAAVLKALDAKPIGTDTHHYQEVADVAQALGLKADAPKLFQVDLLKPAPNATCGPHVIATIAEAVHVLYTVALPGGMTDALRRFREAFKTRYERREVPLLEVLDEESGIGFDRTSADASPLLDGLPIGHPEIPHGGWSPRDAYLLNRLSAVLRDGEQVLELSAADVEALKSGTPAPLPDALSVMASIATASSGAESDLTVSIRHASGPSGANILGRFCRMDPQMHEQVRNHLAKEETTRPDAVFAEIVHLPAGRLANILGRPVLRAYEILYLGRSGAAADRQISLSDLLVSIRDDQVVLRSVRLGREVVPRMTTMHNFSRGQALYRFLCSLQYQGMVSWLAWNWGPLEASPFLPRVRWKRAVFARARWRLTKGDLKAFVDGQSHEQLLTVARWRARWNVPRYVTLIEADNELPVDFENVLSVETLLHLLKRRDQAVFCEMFPAPDVLAAHGPEGRFVHEVIVPFVAEQPRAERPAQTPITLRAETQRSLTPGSEWLFLKLYAGTSSVDRLLTDVLPLLIGTLEQQSAIRRWFFLRYSDPEWHLRIRFNGEPRELQTVVFPAVRAAFEQAFADRVIWRLQIDTYEREIERYGGPVGLALSEELSHVDSVAALEILSLLTGDDGLDARWRICLRSWDLLLDGFGFSLEAKHQIAAASRRQYGREFRIGKESSRAIGDRFRRERKFVEALFAPVAAGHPLAAALGVLERRSHAAGPHLAALRRAHDNHQLTAPLEALAGSHLHMNVFRLLRSSQRQHELVLYDFLERIYESKLARARGRGLRGKEMGAAAVEFQ